VKYPDRERRAAFFDEVIRRVRALPGVQTAAVAGNLPLTYNGDSMNISVEGVPDPPPDQRPDVIFRAIGPGYFGTMGISIIRGRDFTDQDKADSKNVVVISEKTAQHFWPGQDPIGRRLKPGSSTSNTPWREVIGIVKDVRQNDFIAAPKMQMYFTYRQLKHLAANALIVRTSVEPMSFASSIRNAITGCRHRHDGPYRVRGDCQAAIQHAFVRYLCCFGIGSRGRGSLRGDELFSRATHA
jgi:hypothetical protein